MEEGYEEAVKLYSALLVRLSVRDCVPFAAGRTGYACAAGNQTDCGRCDRGGRGRSVDAAFAYDFFDRSGALCIRIHKRVYF